MFDSGGSRKMPPERKSGGRRQKGGLKMHTGFGTSHYLVFAILLGVTGIGTMDTKGVSVERLDSSSVSAAQMDDEVGRLMREKGIPGLDLAILNRGTAVYIKSYGYRDVAKKLPLTPDTEMYAASFCKSVFAYMVMQLVEEGSLDLDNPIYEYLPKPLPEYPKYADLAGDPRWTKITARMLLDHTSGFPNWRRFTESKKLSIYFDPGSRFAYSGEGIDLLQLVIESVTKQPLNTLMQRRIFAPFGMTHTSMTWQPQFEENYANGYDENGKSLGPERRDRPEAAGSMTTTLFDFARFIEAVDAGRGLNATTRQEMLSPQIQIVSKHEFPSISTDVTDENQGIRLSYGLGWGLFHTPLGEAFFKEGHDDGWDHYTVNFDAKKTGIILMSNSGKGSSIFVPLLERLIDDTFTPWDWEGYAPASEK
jgi:CubicO group peptidase (beta-lactamase class C family)